MTFNFDYTCSRASKKYKDVYEEVKDRFNVNILNYVTSYYYHTQHNADKRLYLDHVGKNNKQTYLFNRAWDNNWYCNFIASTAFRTYLQILQSNKQIDNIINYLFMVIKKRFRFTYNSKRWEKLYSRNKKQKKPRYKLLKLQADARKKANKQMKSVLDAIKILLKFNVKESKREVYLNVFRTLMQGASRKETAEKYGYKSEEGIKTILKSLKKWNSDVFTHLEMIRKINKQVKTDKLNKKQKERLTKRYDTKKLNRNCSVEHLIQKNGYEKLTERYSKDYVINDVSYKLKTLNTEIHKQLKDIYSNGYSQRQMNKKIKEFVIDYLEQYNIILKANTNTNKNKKHKLKSKQEILNLLNKTNCDPNLTFYDIYAIIDNKVIRYRDNQGHFIDDGLDIIFKELTNGKKLRAM